MFSFDSATSSHRWSDRWLNFEEYQTVASDNGYRLERGLPLRTDYGPLP
jgi:hypothetical protein